MGSCPEWIGKGQKVVEGTVDLISTRASPPPLPSHPNSTLSSVSEYADLVHSDISTPPLPAPPASGTTHLQRSPHKPAHPQNGSPLRGDAVIAVASLPSGWPSPLRPWCIRCRL